MLNKLLGVKKGNVILKHEFDIGSESATSPICEDIDGDAQIETILTSTKGEVVVFSEDQKIKWKYTVKEKVSSEEEMFLDSQTSNSINQTPLVTDLLGTGKKQIIFGTEFGAVYCLDHTGKKIWSYKTNHPIRGGISDFILKSSNKKVILFGSLDKYIYILSAEGKLLRKILNDTEIESTPVVINNDIVFGDNQGKIKSLNFKGKVNWSYQTKDKIVAMPIYTKLYSGEEAILVSGVDNYMYCLSTKGTLIWKFETKGSIYSEPAILDINNDSLEEIVFGSADGKIYVITMQGNLLWSYETDFWIIGKPITRDVDEDGSVEVVVGSYDNNVYILTGKGLYIIEYVPGVSGIVAQNGNYSDIPSNSPGEIVGDKVWEYSTGGVVVGCAVIKSTIIVQTKEGKVLWIKYEDGK